MSASRDFRNHSVTVKIVNNNIVVTSEEFSLFYSAGPLHKFSLSEIGSAVMKCFHAIAHEKAVKAPERFLTIGEAARILRVSRSTARRLIDQGKIETMWTDGGHRRISSRNLEKVMGLSIVKRVEPYLPLRDPLRSLIP